MMQFISPSNLHFDSNVNKLRYVYIIWVDNYGKKSRFYGKREVYYTGTTTNLGRRFLEHIYHRRSRYLSAYFPDSRKIIVYAEYIYGNEYDARQREKTIQNMSPERKKVLIKSEANILKRYIPLKAIILRGYDSPEEEVLIKI